MRDPNSHHNPAQKHSQNAAMPSALANGQSESALPTTAATTPASAIKAMTSRLRRRVSAEYVPSMKGITDHILCSWALATCTADGANMKQSVAGRTNRTDEGEKCQVHLMV